MKTNLIRFEKNEHLHSSLNVCVSMSWSKPCSYIKLGNPFNVETQLLIDVIDGVIIIITLCSARSSALINIRPICHSPDSSLLCDDQGNLSFVKVVKHIEMPKACPKKSNCHFQKLDLLTFSFLDKLLMFHS